MSDVNETGRGARRDQLGEEGLHASTSPRCPRARSTSTSRASGCASPIQGFGKMWQKTYQVRLPRRERLADRADRDLEAALPRVLARGQPLLRPADRHRARRGGAAQHDPAGQDEALDRRDGALRRRGVVHADDAAGAHVRRLDHVQRTERDGETVAQAQVLMRASDPIFEMGLTLGGHKQEDRFWDADADQRRRALRPRRRRGRHPGRVRGQEAPVVEVAQRLALVGDPLDDVHAGRARPRAAACRSPGGLPDVHRRRRGPERAGGGDRAGAGPGARCWCSRRPATIGRRLPLGRADRCPGFVHDVCSAIHPLALASPFLRTPAARRARPRVVHPEAPLAHPLDDGTAVVLRPLGRRRRPPRSASDGEAYRQLMEPLVAQRGRAVRRDRSARCARRGIRWRWRASGSAALRSATGLAGSRFDGPRGRALLAGLAAHSMLRARRAGRPRAVGARARRWPATPSAGRWRAAARSGSPTRWRRTCARSAARSSPAGGSRTLDELARDACCSTSRRARCWPIAGDRPAGALPPRAARGTATGPGVFKVDWALDGPVPWRAPECRGRATVHLGGTLEEIAASEAAVDRRPRPGAPVRAVRPADGCAIRRARRRASTSAGRTATSRAARPWT